MKFQDNKKRNRLQGLNKQESSESQAKENLNLQMEDESIPMSDEHVQQQIHDSFKVASLQTHNP